MTTHNINWRTFDDQSDINRSWNSPATPTFYIIDHTGTIRPETPAGHYGVEAAGPASRIIA